jgi:hypothetical protein
MNSVLERIVGRQRKQEVPEPLPTRNRVDLRADPAWVARVERQAERLGITVTAYIKQATSRALETDEATDPLLRD